MIVLPAWLPALMIFSLGLWIGATNLARVSMNRNEHVDILAPIIGTLATLLFIVMFVLITYEVIVFK